VAKSGYTMDAFLTQVIDEGIAAARNDYAGEEGNRPAMRAGAVAGFEACRLKTPAELSILLGDARDRTQAAWRAKAADYWYHRCFEGEVEWVCNVLSAVLMNMGLPIIIQPTVRGTLRAAEIVGITE
jgi:hypothetical protein